jgi:hypothetical protein
LDDAITCQAKAAAAAPTSGIFSPNSVSTLSFLTGVSSSDWLFVPAGPWAAGLEARLQVAGPLLDDSGRCCPAVPGSPPSAAPNWPAPAAPILVAGQAGLLVVAAEAGLLPFRAGWVGLLAKSAGWAGLFWVWACWPAAVQATLAGVRAVWPR